jgi:RHS repeat-associated protein
MRRAGRAGLWWPLVAVVLLLAPPPVQAQQVDVGVVATPPLAAPWQWVSLNAAAASQQYPDCDFWSGCQLLGVYAGVSVQGTNGFSQGGSDWGDAYILETSDTAGPGQTMQAATYTASGVVIWDVCYGPPLWWGEIDCQTYDQIVVWGYDQAMVGPTAIPVVDWLSPVSGSGVTQTFQFQVSSAAGAADIRDVWLNINPSGAWTHSCAFGIDAQAATLTLVNDDWSLQAPVALGSGVIVENSQCRVLVGGSGQVASGNARTFVVPIQFKASYAGLQNVYICGRSAGDWWSSCSADLGDWAVPAHSITPDWVSPNSGTGLAQTFTLSVSSSYGSADVAEGWLWFSPTATPPALTSCLIRYTAGSHTLSLRNDTDTAWSTAAVGSAAGLQNSQCAVDTAAAGASGTGDTLVVNVPVLFASSYAGFKNIYMYASSVSGPVSGWQDKGDWDPLCTFELTPEGATLGSSAGSLEVAVTTSSWCSWTVPSSSAFLSLSGGGGTTGSGSVTYSYGSHAGDPRSTQLTIAGTPVSVMQSGTVPTAGEQVLYYHTDALGSVRMLTDAAGDIYPNPQTRMDYTPWGVIFPSTLAVAERRLFTGQERDSSSLDYLGARHYSNHIARFTTVDPGHVGGRIGIPQTWNGYSYAGNNPLRFVDPSGTDYYINAFGGQPFWFEKGMGEFRDLERWIHGQGLQLYGGSYGGLVLNSAGDPVATYSYSTRSARLFGGIARMAAPVADVRSIAEFYAASALIGVTGPATAAAGARYAYHTTFLFPMGGSVAALMSTVQNAALRRALDDIFRWQDRVHGGLVGAVRFTQQTGRLVGGSDHIGKLENSIGRLQNILRDASLSAADRQIAQAVLEQLRTARPLRTSNP